MTTASERILHHLAAVADERRLRQAEPPLLRAVAAVKAFQQARFERTYADLMASPRYTATARFFLDELYGPDDFTARDTQFARIVPAMTRLFSSAVVDTVEALGELHAATEALDTAMGRALVGQAVGRAGYVTAWQAVGQPALRERQIDLTLNIGRSLDRLTSSMVTRRALKLMRGPAQAAGLAALQSFLERGLDAFSAMRGAAAFLAIVEERERDLARLMFAAVPDAITGTLDGLLPD